MVSLRLNRDDEHRLEHLCKLQQKTKSEVLKAALQHYYKTIEAEQSPYELGKDLFGQGSSGETDRSKTYKQRLKAKLRAKHSH